MRQKMRRDDPNCCLILMKYKNLHVSTLKQPKNAKKVKGDRPTDQPTDRPTDPHSDLLSRVHATKKTRFIAICCVLTSIYTDFTNLNTLIFPHFHTCLLSFFDLADTHTYILSQMHKTHICIFPYILSYFNTLTLAYAFFAYSLTYIL